MYIVQNKTLITMNGKKIYDSEKHLAHGEILTSVKRKAQKS